MKPQPPIFRQLQLVQAVRTSHGVGAKRVLLAQNETATSITQIAMTELHAGEVVESHAHETMDEFFLFVEGRALVTIEGTEYVCEKGSFLCVPHGQSHVMKAITEVTVECIGCATE